MLAKVDLDKKTAADEYSTRKDALLSALGAHQRRLRELGIPVIILFDGWGASGKGTIINRLLSALDPRGYEVHALTDESPDEHWRPYFWRWWKRLPSRGRIGIFETAWYEGWTHKYLRTSIGRFEKQLADDGYLVVKFFLHISRKEQKSRFEALESRKESSWRVTGQDWHDNRHYENLYEEYCKRLEKTSTPEAPWHVVEAEDGRWATLKVLTILDDLFGKASKPAAPKPAKAAARPRFPQVLDELGSGQILEPDDYDRKLKDAQSRLRELQYDLYRKRRSVVVLFEGWDAAGKGGAIKRLCHSMDPRGYDVIPVAAPTESERGHHYLWRFWRDLPKDGHLGIFDRSWYGRVLVERVEGFCDQAAWERAYDEINDFEDDMVAHGTIVVKFWLQIDADEQLRRFEERQSIPEKQWKITQEDWRNREKRPQYLQAVEEMLARTSSPQAPWTLVPGNNKLFARLFVVQTLVAVLERSL